MSVIAQLFAPAKYMRVRDAANLKVVIDWLVPLTITAVVCWLAVLAPRSFAIVGENGFSERLSGLLEALVGFYIAALAAVATFPNTSLAAPAYRITLNGKRLVRRNFLCYLFGYLAFIAIGLYLASLFAPLAVGVFQAIGFGPVMDFLRGLLKAGYLLACFQMFSVSLLGLYYLTERIHEVDVVDINESVSTADKKPATRPRRSSRARAAG